MLKQNLLPVFLVLASTLAQDQTKWVDVPLTEGTSARKMLL